MRSHARVVIIGGGVMGVGLLYHLALEGWTDVLLVEKGELTSGSTWHAAGQCPHFNGSLNLTKVHVYGTRLYPKLEALTGQAVSWHGCGGIRLALTEEEVNWFRFVHGLSRLAGYEAHILSPNESGSITPISRPSASGPGFSRSMTATWHQPTSPTRWPPAHAHSAPRSIAAPGQPV